MSGEGKGREGEADPAAGIPVLPEPSRLPGRGGSLGRAGQRGQVPGTLRCPRAACEMTAAPTALQGLPTSHGQRGLNNRWAFPTGCLLPGTAAWARLRSVAPEVLKHGDVQPCACCPRPLSTGGVRPGPAQPCPAAPPVPQAQFRCPSALWERLGTSPLARQVLHTVNSMRNCRLPVRLPKEQGSSYSG